MVVRTGFQLVEGVDLSQSAISSSLIALQIDVMKQELRFLEDLTRATSYEMANDTLTLLDANGFAVAEFE